ncbi:primase-helicase family protein [uncultured Maribacter sp.]|uniref:primase-helicase family protein n=1 Tax=uncultured Maribacter sp. TaxID=431308 RepID=UPI0030DBC697|tara:strand:- start:3089 stop:4294 length:1206 start_codon:yes stop_codon:yes gene_type:complete
MKTVPYLRVGTSYYKLVQAPTIAGHFNEILVHWNIETIRQDHGKDYLSKVPKYDGFTCIPNHIDFKQEYKGFYNTYSPLPAIPKEGVYQSSLNFVKHIFGKHYELGLDYLELLYTRPVQVLPILCLVSKERSTGKSTFLKWLKAIFDNNMTYLTNDSFSSQFNADWANKLLICIDEVLFNKEELTERIKYLSTTNINKLEAKGKDKREVEFFGKFILCSNNEDNFIKIDGNETRFWVLKIPVLKKEETDFLNQLKSEIPTFLHYIQKRQLSSEHTTRMWFTPKQIRTVALRRLVQNNRNRVEKELASILFSVMEKFELEEIHLCPIDALHLLNKTRVKTDLTQLRKLLKNDWKLVNQDNSNKYQKVTIWSDGDIHMTDAKGRYFTVEKDFLNKNFDDTMTE